MICVSWSCVYPNLGLQGVSLGPNFSGLNENGSDLSRVEIVNKPVEFNGRPRFGLCHEIEQIQWNGTEIPNRTEIQFLTGDPTQAHLFTGTLIFFGSLCC